MNPLLQLLEHSQSCWLDNLTRSKIKSGELTRRMNEEGLRGITSNPALFDKAIRGSRDYDEQINQLVRDQCSVPEIYEVLTTTDVRDACDILRPVYDDSQGKDGFVSLEVSPHLAHDTAGSIAEGKRLAERVDRPNLFIKIPGTAEGVPAIEELLFEGLNVNVTLLFSVGAYQAVAEAYIRALERRREAGKPVDNVTSVASFFLSRIDNLVDQLLSHRIQPGADTPLSRKAQSLLGKSAVANAKLAYQQFKANIDSERWQSLARDGARIQRMLWASTSTKNPNYYDLMYVEPLIGPHTVNTMPDETIAAFADHGKVTDTVEEGVEEARQVMANLQELGIEFDAITTQLENEGVQKFIDPYDDSMDALAERCRQYRRQRDAASLAAMATKLRRHSIEMTTAAGSGHATSSLSAAEIVSALFFRQMRWDPADPSARNVDQFILSKGHATPVLWAALKEAGAIDEDLKSLRKIDSTLEGHPTPNNPWVKIATGSLGQGLSGAGGLALANKLDGIDARVYCLLGDGECAEGSVWEAAQFAALQQLDNLIAIVDVNALGQSEPAPYGHHTEVFRRRFEAFGWHAVECDGHDVVALLNALEEIQKSGPLAIIAKTEKGKGVSFLEGQDGWHGKPLPADQAKQALAELGESDVNLSVTPQRIGRYTPPERGTVPRLSLDYELGQAVATRDGYGNALAKLGDAMAEIVALDGDVKDSTRAKLFAQRHPQRFFQGYIAEQNMVGAALGLAVSHKLPFVASFACFLTRAADFIRMAGHSRPPQMVFCGSHAGVSIGEDGPSQMGLEDLAMFRALGNSTVLYPCDGVSAERLTEEAARQPGLVYLRTTRGKTPTLYDNDETFPVGGSKVLRQSDQDAATVVAAGITVHEALAAHEALAQDGLAIRVIDAYSVKPLDIETLSQAARGTGSIVVVEDHWMDGGLGDAVAAAIAGQAPVHKLAVTGEPRSGKPEELLDRHGISRRAIADQVRAIAG